MQRRFQKMSINKQHNFSKHYLFLSIYLHKLMHKKWTFRLRISLVNVTMAIIFKGNFILRGQFQGTIFLRGNYPRGQLSGGGGQSCKGQLSRGQFSLGSIALELSFMHYLSRQAFLCLLLLLLMPPINWCNCFSICFISVYLFYVVFFFEKTE